MKCNTLVLWRDARRKGSGKPYRKAVRWYHSAFPPEAIPESERADLVKCEGTISATVAAVNEAEWGGCYAALEIAYKCDTCGASAFPHLPNDAASLSVALTRYVEAL